MARNKGFTWAGAIKGVFGGGIVALVVAGTAVMTYLKGIGRTDLLQYAFGSKEVMGLIFALAVLFAALYVICIFFSAFVTHVALDVFPAPGDVPSGMAWLVPVAHATWIAIMLYYFREPVVFGWRYSSYFLPIAFLVYFAAVVISAFFVQRSHDKRRSCWQFSRPPLKIGVPLLVGFLVSAAPNLATTGLVFILYLDPSIGRDAPLYWVLIIIAAVTVPGAFVSSTLAIAHVRGRDGRVALKTAAFAMLALVVAASVVLPRVTVLPVGMRALGVAGVFSLESGTYVVGKDQLAVAEAVGLSVAKKDLSLIQGYERFRLGDIVVLCKSPWDILDRAKATEDPKSGCMDFKREELRRASAM